MTTLKEQINKDLIQAMKAKDAVRKGVLQLVKAGIQNAEIEAQFEFNDEDVIKIIQREIKQQKQSLEAFANGGRLDLSTETKVKINILESYLPTQLSEKEIESILLNNGIVKGMNMGEAMKLANSVIERGTAEPRLISLVVKSLIN